MNKKLCGVVAAIAMSWAGQAASAVLMATYTGTVGTGIDVTGVFGAQGADLAGQSYKAVYIYDTSIGEHVSLPQPHGLEWVMGSTYDLTPHPVTSATLTIAGATIAVTPYGESYVERQVTPLGGHFANLSNGQINTLSNWLITSDPSVLPGSLVSPFSMVGQDIGAASFAWGTQDYWTMYYSGEGRVVVTLLSSGVPEPATWAMMIAGFGLAGTALRRRRQMAITV